LEKLADRMEGETMMSFFEHLSTRDVAATLTVLARETRTADEAPRANLSAIVCFVVCSGLRRLLRVKSAY
jgi:hypothetical protein